MVINEIFGSCCCLFVFVFVLFLFFSNMNMVLLLCLIFSNMNISLEFVLTLSEVADKYVFAVLFRTSLRVKGSDIGRTECKIGVFVDDTLLCLDII